jgi:hypothetical protein
MYTFGISKKTSDGEFYFIPTTDVGIPVSLALDGAKRNAQEYLRNSGAPADATFVLLEVGNLTERRLLRVIGSGARL